MLMTLSGKELQNSKKKGTTKPYTKLNNEKRGGNTLLLRIFGINIQLS